MKGSEKINRLLEHFSLNPSDLAKKLGLKYAQNIYDIQNDKIDISKSMANKITAAFPDVNKNWLLTGEGEMLKSKTGENSDNPADMNYVPLLPIAAQGGSLNDFIVSVKDSDCERIISPIKGADFAITVAGDSMAPEYPSGAQILIKRINEKAFIDWGKVYVLDTCNGSVIKILTPSEKEGYVKCTSINPDPKYATFDVSFNDINGVYRVMLCMSIK
jgi:phage repressor protein C with HTH and peptisase S24 domain